MQRRKRRHLNISHIVSTLFFMIALIAITYIVVSWIDIVTHNHMVCPVYQRWNLFTLIA